MAIVHTFIVVIQHSLQCPIFSNKTFHSNYTFHWFQVFLFFFFFWNLNDFFLDSGIQAFRSNRIGLMSWECFSKMKKKTHTQISLNAFFPFSFARNVIRSQTFDTWAHLFAFEFDRNASNSMTINVTYMQTKNIEFAVNPYDRVRSINNNQMELHAHLGLAFGFFWLQTWVFVQ